MGDLCRVMLAVAALNCCELSLAIDSFAKIPLQRPDNLASQSEYQSESYTFDVLARYQEDTIPLNRIHSWQLQIRNPDGSPVSAADIGLNVTMPEHLHDMRTKTVIKPTGVAG